MSQTKTVSSSKSMLAHAAVASFSVGALVFLSGCATSAIGTAAGPGTVNIAALSGHVHGGQQPVSGSLIQLYAAGSGGYGSAATPLISATVRSDNSGNFSITGDYTCPANSQVYITATGGNPGLAPGTNNSSLALMTALGPCSSLSSSTFISINELTTVASVWSLSRFMAGSSALGTSSTNIAGLQSAFAAVNKVVNTATGTLPGTTLPTNAILPQAEINTLGNILASCVNSSGGTAGDPTLCGQLFTASTPSGGAAPTDTLAAALNISRNPGSNLVSLFNLSSASSPFQPALTSTPNNFLIGINYAGGGLSAPKGLALDAAGNVWLANSGNSSLTELNSNGTALSPSTGYTGGGLSAPSSLAIDPNGAVWVANAAGNSVSKFTAAGSPFVATAYTGGGLSTPRSISIDGTGNVWLANYGNSSVTELSSTGVALSPANGYTGAGITQPTGVAVNPR